MILQNCGCVKSASPSKRVWHVTPEVIPLAGFAPQQKRPVVQRVAAQFGPTYAQKAKALLLASFDMGESVRYRVIEQVDSELVNYLYAAISCIGQGCMKMRYGLCVYSQRAVLHSWRRTKAASW